MRHCLKEFVAFFKVDHVLALKNLWLNVTLLPLLDGFLMCVLDSIASMDFVEKKNVYYKCYIKE